MFVWQDLVFTVNNFVERDEKVEWEKINPESRKYYLTTLLHTAEKQTLTLSTGYKRSVQMQVDAGDVGETSEKQDELSSFIFI